MDQLLATIGLLSSHLVIGFIALISSGFLFAKAFDLKPGKARAIFNIGILQIDQTGDAVFASIIVWILLVLLIGWKFSDATEYIVTINFGVHISRPSCIVFFSQMILLAIAAFLWAIMQIMRQLASLALSKKTAADEKQLEKIFGRLHEDE